MGRPLVWLAALALFACGSENAPTPAGTGGAGGGSAPVPPDAGLGPWTCMPGEREQDDGSCLAAGVPPEACAEGFVADGAEGCVAVLPEDDCAPGLMAIPGESRCREVSPCAEGRWGDIPTAATTEHVDASYLGGGENGDAATPWTTVQQAIDAAADGAIVAVAAGSYSEDLVIEGKSLQLWGRCPELVSVSGVGETAAVSVLAGASGTTVRGLALTGVGRGLYVDGAEDVLVERTWIHDTANHALVCFATTAPSSATLLDSLLEGFTKVGAFTRGCALRVERSALRSAAGAADSRPVEAQCDIPNETVAIAEIEASLLEGGGWATVYDIGSLVTITGSALRGRPDVGGGPGIGVIAQACAQLGLAASVVMRASTIEGAGTGLDMQSSYLELEHSVVRDTTPGVAPFSRGIGVSIGHYFATVPAPAFTVVGSLVERARLIGVTANGVSGSIAGLLVRDTLEATVGEMSGGIALFLDCGPIGACGEVMVAGSRFEQSRAGGVVVQGSTATLDTTAVLDTAPDQDGQFGRGVSVEPFPGGRTVTQLTMRRCLVERNLEGGVVVLGANALLESTAIRDTRPRQADGLYGVGVLVQTPLEIVAAATDTVAVLRECEIADSHFAGVIIGSAEASLERTVVRDTRAVAGPLFGDGVLLHDLGLGPAALTVKESRIAGSGRAGVANFAGTTRLEHSLFDCNPIDLDGEGAFDFQDLGDNACLCGDETRSCKVLSANLAPPPEFSSP